jgi:hypothetical protein
MLVGSQADHGLMQDQVGDKLETFEVYEKLNVIRTTYIGFGGVIWREEFSEMGIQQLLFAPVRLEDASSVGYGS